MSGNPLAACNKDRSGGTADISHLTGPLIGCAVTTGVGATLNTTKVAPGSSVAVFGAGGVGLSIIMGAKLAGARQIIAIDTSEAKGDIAATFGATDFLPAHQDVEDHPWRVLAARRPYSKKDQR